MVEADERTAQDQECLMEAPRRSWRVMSRREQLSRVGVRAITQPCHPGRWLEMALLWAIRPLSRRRRDM